MIYPHEHQADSYQCIAAWHLQSADEADKLVLTVEDRILLRGLKIGF